MNSEGSTICTGPAADLALRIAFDGLRPTAPTFAPVTRGSIGGKELAKPSSSSIIVNAGDLIVQLDGELRDFVSVLEDGTERPGAATLLLQDGTEIFARFGLFVQAQTGDQTRPCSRTARLIDWNAVRGTPWIWTGTIAGDFARRAHGNLLLREYGPQSVSVSTTNLRMEGNYLWIIVGEADGAIVVLDTRGQPLDRQLVISDLCALQLTFGRRLVLPWLVGVDSDCSPVSWAGIAAVGRNEANTENAAEPPIPIGPGTAGCWAPALFARVARALAQPDESPSWVVLNTYLDSLDEHLDGAYLKVQVALEALCGTMRDAKASTLVADPKAWLRWVESLDGEIRAHAADAASAQKLVGKVKAAMHAPATDVVRGALAKLGLQPPQEMLDEIANRNAVVHAFLMSREGTERDLHNDRTRLRVLRTALFAVYAVMIGYDGPITSWETHREIIADWFPYSTRVDDLPTFECRRSR